MRAGGDRAEVGFAALVLIAQNPGMDIDDDYADEGEPTLRVLPPLLLLSAQTRCWKCGQPVKAVALAAHALEEDGEQVGDPADTADMLVLTDVDFMPPEVLHELVQRNPNYSKRYSHTAGDSYFANNCDCGTFTGDFYLHMEPGGAFFPTTVEEAAGITVERLAFKEPIDLGAAWGSGTGDFILAHARVIDAPDAQGPGSTA